MLIFYLAFASYLGVAAIVSMVQGHWLVGVETYLFAMSVGTFMLVRASWLKIGYSRGRMSLIDSLLEARKRGLTQDEWLDAEIERDLGTSVIEKRPDG